MMTSLSLFIFYLAVNQFLNANSLMEWADQLFQDEQRFDAPEMDYLIIKLKSIMRKFSNLDSNRPKSLFYLAKFKIRQSLRYRSNESLNRLLKSKFFQNEIIETVKVIKEYFNNNSFNFDST